MPMNAKLGRNNTPCSILLNILLAAASLFVNGFGVYLTIQANIGAGPIMQMAFQLVHFDATHVGHQRLQDSFRVFLAGHGPLTS